MHLHISTVKKSELVPDGYYWSVYLIGRVCVVLSVLRSSPDGWRLLKKERYMKIKDKSYTQAHTNTQIHLFPPPPSPLTLCQEAICLGKPKRDLVCTLHWKSN